MGADDKEYGIIANVLSDHVLRTGAKVWILYCNGDAEHPKVMGLSKSGRKVIKYMPFKRLTKFRSAWVPDHLRDQVSSYSKELAAQYAMDLNERWSGVRFFHPDGQLLKDGIPASQVWRRRSGDTKT